MNILRNFYFFVFEIIIVSIVAGPFLAHADLNQGLMAYWSFDNCDATDDSGNGNSGTIMGTPQCVDGVQGHALKFTGRNHTGADGDHILLPNLDFSNSDELTICLWANEEGFSSPHGEAYIFFGGIGDEPSIGIDRTTPGDSSGYFIRFYSHADHYNPALYYPFPLKNRNKFVFYCLVNKNNTLYAYQNATLLGSKKQAIANPQQHAAIARHWWGSTGTSTRLNGTIDEVRVYNRALTLSEINQLYADGGGTSNHFYDLTISLAGTGNGQVTSSDGYISCRGDGTIECSGSYASGRQVGLTVTPDPGSIFTGWGGDCQSCGTSSNCNIDIYENKACTAIFQSTTAQVDLENGLEAYFPLDGDLNNHSALNLDINPEGDFSFSNGMYSRAAIFNGSDNRLYINTPLTNKTISLWFYAYNVEKGQTLIMTGDAGACSYKPRLSICNGYLLFAVSGCSNTGLIAKARINANEWYHVVIIAENGKQQIWLNGILVDSNNLNNVSIGGSPTAIGSFASHAGPSAYFNGLLDEIRVYDRELSNGEIQALYGKRPQLSSFHILSSWPFDLENQGIGCLTYSGHNNMPQLQAGKIGNALHLSGNEELYVPSGIVNKDVSFTVTAWVKPEFSGDSTGTIVFERQKDGGDHCGSDSAGNFGLQIYHGKFAFEISTIENGTCRHERIIADDPVEAGKYYFVSGVYNRQQGQIELYIDGQFSCSLRVGPHLRTNPRAWLRIGNNSPIAQQYWIGEIDELTIYNRALSSAEITSLFSNGGGSSGSLYSLRIETTGTGPGQVTSSDGGISCGSRSGNDCSESYPTGTFVTLEATADSNATFSGWGGDCQQCGTQDSCHLYITSDLNCEAHFEGMSVAYSNVTVLHKGNGDGIVVSEPSGINCGAGQNDCSHDFSPGQTITLRALPVDNCEFLGWEGESCSGTDETCTFTLQSDVHVSAKFQMKSSGKLVISHIPSPGVVGSPIRVKLTKLDASGNVDTFYDKYVDISIPGVPISPSKVQLIDGSAEFSITPLIQTNLKGIYIHAQQGSLYVDSNKFDITGSPNNRHAVLFVIVKDEQGHPVVGASVIITNFDGIIGDKVTDGYGKVTFIDLPASTSVNIEVFKDGHRALVIGTILQNGISVSEITLDTGTNIGKQPVILVPGAFGSDSKWQPGNIAPKLPKTRPADADKLVIHNPYWVVGWTKLKNALESNGFAVYQCPWDWRFHPGSPEAQKYLRDCIDKAKRETHIDQVDVVAHSQGGHLVRAYIQNVGYRWYDENGNLHIEQLAPYRNDIKKLVLVGTPNHGAPLMYPAWSGGDPLLADHIKGDKGCYDLGNVAMGRYFYSRVFNGEYENIFGISPIKMNPEGCWLCCPPVYNTSVSREDRYRFIHDYIKGAHSLIPDSEIKFLCDTNIASAAQCKSNARAIGNNSETTNVWLNELNSSINLAPLLAMGDNVYVLGSESQNDTLRYLRVKKSDSSNIYVDGIPVENKWIYGVGDGTVPRDSLDIPGLTCDVTEPGDHKSLPGVYKDEIVAFLKEGQSIDSGTHKMQALGMANESPQTVPVLSFETSGFYALLITSPDGTRNGIDSDANQLYNETEGVNIIRNNDTSSVSIKNPGFGIYQITITGSFQDRVILHIGYQNGEQVSSLDVPVYFHGSPLTLKVSFQNDGQPVLSLVSNQGPPINLHVNSAEGKTILTWSPPKTGNPASYEIYSRLITEPFFQSLVTVDGSAHSWNTGQDINWPQRLYVVSAVGENGEESMLTDAVLNREPEAYSLILKVTGEGNGRIEGTAVSCNDTCVEYVTSGKTLQLNAIPGESSTFSGWDGDCSSCGTSQTCEILVDENRVCQAQFQPIEGEASLRFAVPEGGLHLNQQATITVYIDNDEQVGSFQMEMDYDPDFLEVQQIQSTFPNFNSNIGNGHAVVVGFSTSGVSGPEIKLFTITVLPKEAGSTSMDFTPDALSDPQGTNIAILSQDLSVEIKDVTIGDVNGDGTLNIVDALFIARHAVGLTVNNFNKDAADVNCDGQVDIVDALFVARKAVGLTVNGWCGENNNI